jgi:hypothetical protein
MTFTQVKITGKVSSETFGCEKPYFDQFIKGKPLTIIFTSPTTHYLLVEDENKEQWALFKGQYTILTGSADPAPVTKAKAKKAHVSRKKTG